MSYAIFSGSVVGLERCHNSAFFAHLCVQIYLESRKENTYYFFWKKFL